MLCSDASASGMVSQPRALSQWVWVELLIQTFPQLSNCKLRVCCSLQ